MKRRNDPAQKVKGNGKKERESFRRPDMDEKIWEKSSGSPEETEAAGEELAPMLSRGSFIAINGELGAGKTAFVRGICRAFCPKARVCSPTYTVMRRYDGGICPFYHFDLYRITSDEDLESTGFYDCRDGVIAAEWCEKAPQALPRAYYEVTIEKTGETARRITLIRRGG